MGAVLPPSVHVAGGLLYFVDAKGVIRTLASDGTVRTVTRLPLTSTQQMVSFAVSPDGGSILGTVFTAPPDAFPCDGSYSRGTFVFDAYSARPGGSAKLLYRQTSTRRPPNVIELTDWDEIGPVGTYPTVWATQGGGPGSFMGPYVRIKAETLKVGAPFPGQDACKVWDTVASGSFVCTGDEVESDDGTGGQQVTENVSVRHADGREIWHVTVTSDSGDIGSVLSPDATHVTVVCGPGADVHDCVAGEDGSFVDMGSFVAYEWLDSRTMIGFVEVGGGSDAYADVSDPSAYTTLPIAGEFIGTIRT